MKRCIVLFVSAIAFVFLLNSCRTIHVRKDFTTLTTDEIETFKNGISVMKSRPASDPTSWIYQANIHGTATIPAQTAWNTCQHGSFFFLSWHRMYLYYFERILRDACGDPDFALPYWNYTHDLPPSPAYRQLPLEFREPANSSNPLYVSARNAIMNAGGTLPESSVDLAAFQYSNFSSTTGSSFSFGGQELSSPSHSASPHSQFEMVPHDQIHGDVGGWMSSFSTAAQDPIFWLHHANIDRLWIAWNKSGCSNTNHAGWLSQQFTFFDETGAAVTLTGAQILNTATQLNYKYDNYPNVITPCQTSTGRDILEIIQKWQKKLIGILENLRFSGKPKTFTLEFPDSAYKNESEYILKLEGVKIDSLYPKGNYEIYINLPEGEKPYFKNKYYIGKLGFFGLVPLSSAENAHGHSTSAMQEYHITKTITELYNMNELKEELRITFILKEPQAPPNFDLREDDIPATVLIDSVKIVRYDVPGNE